jgi:MtrB/PioB family decaheme-associated outer membrane protein
MGVTQMEVRKQTLIARVAGAAAGAIALAAFSQAFAADAETAAKAPPPPPASDWYFYGGLETGGRVVVNRPPSGFGTATPCIVGGFPTTCFTTPSQTQSRAKFEEYGKVPSAPFLDWMNLQAGTKDGRFAFDFWGRNFGLNNQNYGFTVSQPGQHYFTFEWDQTPHLLSTSGKTVFGGVGTTSLTVNPALQTSLTPFLGTANTDPAARANIQTLINGAVMPLELGTRRDRATAAYRWTPTPDWDLSVLYSNERRTGVVPASIPAFFDTGAPAATHYPIGLPKPIDETTQNIEASGERSGIDFLGARWTSNIVYNGSLYNNNLKQLDAQNPLCTQTGVPTCDVTGASLFTAPTALRMSLDPSNMANGVTWNTAANIPFWKTRYVSTVQYNNMRQNDSFIDTSINGLTALPVTLQNGAPVSSLNGQIETLLWNNVLTMRPDKDWRLTMRGRHYALNNDTPSLHIDDWISADTQFAGQARNSLPISYTKDNASAEARWNPVKWATLGTSYNYERWDRTFRDANITNENSGKVFVDATPWENVVARASYLYGERRYETYDTGLFVLTPGLFADQFATNLRRFDLSNRNRQKADAQVDFAVSKFLTLSPNAGLRWDDYPDSVMNPMGLQKNHSWNAGLEVGAAVDPRVKLMFAYTYENTRLHMAGGNGNSFGGSCPGPDLTNTFNPMECTWLGDIDQKYHTFLAAANLKVVPDKFDLRLEALYTRASESSNLTPCASGAGCDGIDGQDPSSVNFGQFPPQNVAFQKYSAIGRYYVDPIFVRKMGWADVVIKGRYSFVHNSASSYQFNNATPYVATGDGILEGGSRALFLAATNPNYSAHIFAISTEIKW